MKIGIDARFFGKAGPGRFTKAIIQHLELIDKENEYLIFLTPDGYESYQPKNERFKKVMADHMWYSFDEQTRFFLKVFKANLDLLFVPHFNIPVLYPKKIVTAIPDMTMHTYSTERGTTLPVWYFRIKRLVYRLVFWWAVLRSYRVIVPSNTVIDDFMEHLNFPREKYVLAYEGVDPDFAKTVENPHELIKKYSLKEKFVLSVGSMYEHKNVEGLIEMFKILKSKYGYKGQLVLASKRDKFTKRIFDKVKEERLDDDIKVLAYLVPEGPSEIVVTDEEVIALRQLADAYVMGAFKEGFSLTALEGQAIGLPAALSDIDCHREVYNDSVLFFDPHKPEDIAEKVNALIVDEDLKKEYIKRGYDQVKKYDWKKCAQITLDVFNEAVSQ